MVVHAGRSRAPRRFRPSGARADEVSALLAAGEAERNGLVVRALIADERQRLGAISFRDLERARRRRSSGPARDRGHARAVARARRARAAARGRGRAAHAAERSSSAGSSSGSSTRSRSASTSSTASTASQAWNRKRETGMQGVSREEAIGRTIFEILHRQPADSLRQRVRRSLRDRAACRPSTWSRRRAASCARSASRRSRCGSTDGRHHARDRDRRGRHRVARGAGAVRPGREARRHRPARRGRHARDQQSARDDRRLRREPRRCARRHAPTAATPRDGDEYLRIIDNEVHRCKGIIDWPARLQPAEGGRQGEHVDINDGRRAHAVPRQAPRALQEDAASRRELERPARAGRTANASSSSRSSWRC